LIPAAGMSILAGMDKPLLREPNAGLILVAMSLVLTGCSFFKGGPGGSAPPPAAGSADAWQIKPARMRVYPSTRITRDGTNWVLDARLEFLDDAGDSMKAAGNLRLELFAMGRPGDPPTGKQLYVWDVPMLTLEQNRQYFEITHTYLFRLKLDDATLATQRLILAANCVLADGRSLQARAAIGAEGVIPDGAGQP
jgi:hypothetical protein